MEEIYHIYIDRLRDGAIEEINQEVPADFLEINEKELRFDAPVLVKGQAYVAEQSLVLKLHIEAYAIMPCAICNEETDVKILLPDFYHCVSLDMISGNILDFRKVIREDILLEVPQFAECNQANCPKREEMEKYMNQKDKKESQNPFADLEII